MNIIARDFNTNLNLETNRISQVPAQYDQSKGLLENLTKDYIDTVFFSKESPFFIYYQTT